MYAFPDFHSQLNVYAILEICAGKCILTCYSFVTFGHFYSVSFKRLELNVQIEKKSVVFFILNKTCQLMCF